MADPIKFSVVIPTYGRPEQLRNCLDAVSRLEYPQNDFEVLTVDDGSESPPEDLVRQFQDKLNVLLIKAPHGGPAAARNAGAAQAKGTYLAFTDDDCFPSPDWLQALANRLSSVPDRAIGGHAVNAMTGNPYSAASQMLLDYLYQHFNVEGGAASFIGAANICVPAGRFREIGGFNANFPFSAEDREFCDRWLHAGHSLIYAPEVIVYHAHSLTLRTFWRQQFSYARGGPYVRELQLTRGRQGVGIKPLSFYLNLLRYPFSHERNGQALRLSLLLGLSQLATVAGFSWEKIVSKTRRGRQTGP